MKKLLFFVFMFFLSYQTSFAGCIIQTVASNVTCTSCTGDLTFAWYMEDQDVKIGDPCGCSAGDDEATLNNATLVVSTVPPNVGTYMLYSANTSGTSYNAVFSNTSDAIVDPDQGTITFDFYITEWDTNTELFSVFYSATERLTIYLTGADSPSIDIGIKYKSSASDVTVYLNTAGEADLSENTLYSITVSWQTSGTPNVFGQITGKDSDSSDTDLTAFASDGPVYVGNRDPNRAGKFYIGNVKIYDTVQ